MKINLKKKLLFTTVVLLFALICFSGLVFSKQEARTVYAETEQQDLLFTLIDNNTAYKVTALNKSLTIANIPSEYNELPVTEIGDSGFSRCSNLVDVLIPYTVKRIGSNAFAACTNLTNISGMSYVQEIGNNAFANCTKLDKLILPATIQTLGSNVLRNNPNEIYSRLSENTMNALNSAWKSNIATAATVHYGNNLVYVEHYDEDQIIDGYEIKEYQNLIGDDSDNDFIVYSSFNNLPVYNIQAEAFAFCEFNSLTIKHNATDNCTHTVNISNQAFTFLLANQVNIEVDVSFYDEAGNEQGQSTGVFQDAEITGIKLPASLTYIPESMFLGCSWLENITSTDANVQNNYLSNNITEIGAQAFEGCTSISVLHIPSSITSVGNSAFNGLGFSSIAQTLYIDLYEPGILWDLSWCGTTGTNCDIRFNTVTVTFYPENGTAVTTETISYGKTQLLYTQKPTKDDTNYVFQGYYTHSDGQGERCYDDNMNIDKLFAIGQSNITLYAYWYTPTVIIELKNGDTVVGSFEQDYDVQLKTVETLMATGKVFRGYYTQPNGQGVQYYDTNGNGVRICDLTENTILYAYWENIIYTIQYISADDSQYITDIPETVAPSTYTVDDNVDFENQEYLGYSYEFFHNGIEKGSTGNIGVVARKSIVTYTITYVLNQGVEYGVNNPSNPSTITVVDTVALQDPVNEYIPFLGWYMGDVQVTTLSNITENIQLTAKWDSGYGKYCLTDSNVTYTINSGSHFYLILPTTAVSGCHFNVTADIDTLEVIGTANVTYGMSINAEMRTDDFVLKMQNVIMESSASSGISVSSNVELKFYTYGTVKIIGRQGATCCNGGLGISCYKLVILSADDLIIQGGNGGNGASGTATHRNGYDGGDGSGAVYVTGNYVYSCDHVCFIGGNGGNGGDGLLAANTVGGSGGAGSKAFWAQSETIDFVTPIGAINTNVIDGTDGSNGMGGVIVPTIPVTPDV